MKITILEYFDNTWKLWGVTKKNPLDAIEWYIKEHSLDYDGMPDILNADGFWFVPDEIRAWQDKLME